MADLWKRCTSSIFLCASIEDPTRFAEAMAFDQDVKPRPYDADYAGRFWRILQQADRVFKIYRARFLGKCSPVHFFWGAADLAVTRFSGRTAPQHPGGVPNLPDWITREAYSHEVSSCGFWPGSGPVPYAAYAYPEPAGFSKASVKPKSAFYRDDLREFILPCDRSVSRSRLTRSYSSFYRLPMKQRQI
jgi:hypothetical protein